MRLTISNFTCAHLQCSACRWTAVKHAIRGCIHTYSIDVNSGVWWEAVDGRVFKIGHSYHAPLPGILESFWANPTVSAAVPSLLPSPPQVSVSGVLVPSQSLKFPLYLVISHQLLHDCIRVCFYCSIYLFCSEYMCHFLDCILYM